jgi:3',5'-cyclic AMP phosphodiesterase CpdA
LNLERFAVRTIAHLSDLHFGRIEDGIVEALIRAIRELRPDLIAVSGDLTQRARVREFEQAREFLRALPEPQIVVPGNHDIPLYNLYARFARALHRYRRYISEELEPFYTDDEIAVQGVNTARSLTFKGGRVNQRQVALLERRLGRVDGLTKIVVTHHPFDLPQPYPNKALVGRARMALLRLAGSGIDLFLAGHLHVGMTEKLPLRFKIAGCAPLLLQAGSATSSRRRGAPNSFNLIRVHRPSITVDRFNAVDEDRRFHRAVTSRFRHTETGWVAQDDSSEEIVLAP